MLVEDPVDHPMQGGLVPRSRTRWIAIGAVGAVIALLVTLQIVAHGQGFTGPLTNIWRDYVGAPKSMTLPWGGLTLALVGLSWRSRFIAVGVALALDAVFVGARLLAGDPFTVGNGPTWVLTGIIVVAVLRWQGTQRRNALYAAALGVLLIWSTKVGDVWLVITIITQPVVLDEYVLLADHALGDPAWVVGRVLETLGPVASAVLHWVYIELPVAAIVATLWQLRGVQRTGVWPSHYLVRTFLVLGLVGPLLYVVFPVVGPIYAYSPEGNGFQIDNYWPNVVPPIDRDPGALVFNSETSRNCMPSMHTAWALAVFLHTRRDVGGVLAPRWLRWGGMFWLLATLAATLGFGYHYGVDLVAGAVLCLTVDSALRDPERGWGWFRIRLVVAGTVIMAALLLGYRYLAVHMADYPVLAGTIVAALLALMCAGFHATWFTQRERRGVEASASR